MIKINNNFDKNMKINKETIYGTCRLLTLEQIENVLKSDSNFVLLYIGDEVNYLYCDPIPNEELAKKSAKQTDGYYLSKKEFIDEISPRLSGI